MKKGFTLIEIILSLSLISLIGITTTVLILNNNKNKEIKILKQNSQKLENALNVYLDSHPEVTTNLNDNAKAAIVTLETLKSEGLISDKLDVNYKNEYFLLSNARLLDSESEKNKADCNNDVISVEIFKKWDLTETDGSKVIYVCPKNGDETNNNVNVEELQKRVEALESLSNNTIYYYKGENVNNYVRFPVETKNTNILYQVQYNNNNNLWRIVFKYGHTGKYGNIKLVNSSYLDKNKNTKIPVNKNIYSLKSYHNKKFLNDDAISNDNTVYSIYNCYVNNKKDSSMIYAVINGNNTNAFYIMSNSFKNINESTEIVKIGKLEEVFNNTDNYTCGIQTSDKFNLYEDFYYSLNLNNQDFIYEEYNYKEILHYNYKHYIYENIKYKKYVDLYPYYYRPSGTAKGEFDFYSVDYSQPKYQYVGNINTEEYLKTKSNDKSWLDSYYSDSVPIGFYTYSGYQYFVTIYSLNKRLADWDLSYLFDKTFDYYIPVITLASGLELIEDASCSSTYTPGSINCPYLLKDSDGNILR